MDEPRGRLQADECAGRGPASVYARPSTDSPGGRTESPERLCPRLSRICAGSPWEPRGSGAPDPPVAGAAFANRRHTANGGPDIRKHRPAETDPGDLEGCSTVTARRDRRFSGNEGPEPRPWFYRIIEQPQATMRRHCPWQRSK